MRKAEFNVPVDLLEEFTDLLMETGLDNHITGRTSEGEITVGVNYEKSETQQVDELEEQYIDLMREAGYDVPEETEEEEETEE
jgi:hypothetical protein